jgi:hypothetical protein
MKCPRCLVPMTASRLDMGGLIIDAHDCRTCTGHFIGFADLKAVESVVDVRLLKWRNLPGLETQGRILFCPKCPGVKPMEKIVSERDQRVVMDICHSCDSVWLDRGELEAIQQKGLLGTLADIIAFVRRG